MSTRISLAAARVARSPRHPVAPRARGPAGASPTAAAPTAPAAPRAATPVPSSRDAPRSAARGGRTTTAPPATSTSRRRRLRRPHRVAVAAAVGAVRRRLLLGLGVGAKFGAGDVVGVRRVLLGLDESVPRLVRRGREGVAERRRRRAASSKRAAARSCSPQGLIGWRRRRSHEVSMTSWPTQWRTTARWWTPISASHAWRETTYAAHSFRSRER